MSTNDPSPPAVSPRSVAFCRPWLLGLVVVYYAIVALTRGVDGDEGFFLYASRLIHEGLMPYRDFFDPHLPTIPYLWTLAFVFHGPNWIYARLIGMAVATLCAWIFARLLMRATSHRGVFGVAMAAYLLSDFGLEWAVVVKTFSLATVFMMGGWAAGSSRLASERHWGGAWLWLLSGLLAALTLGTRLMTVPTTGIIFVFVLLRAWSSRSSLARAAAWWLAGAVVSYLFLLAIYLQAPFEIRFTNWNYHFLDAIPFRERLRPNLATALDRIFLQPAWLASFLLIARDHLKRRAIGIDGWLYRLVFAELFFTAFIPPRAFHQYYCLATPWLFLAAVPGLEDWWRRAGSPWWRRLGPEARALLTAAALLLLFIEPYRAMERRWPSWTWRPGTPEAREEFDWRLSTIREVGRRIDALAPPGARMLTWWPGYALETRTKIVPGMEDQFGLRVGYYVSDPQMRKRLHVLNQDDVDRMIRQREPAIVVVGLWAGIESRAGRKYYERLLAQCGYVAADHFGTTVIYALPNLRRDMAAKTR